MAPHSSTLAWKIPWMVEPGGLQSMGSLRGRHDWATSLSPFTFLHWRRTWQPTPVFLPGESQGWGSLVGCRLWVAQSWTRLKRLSSRYHWATFTFHFQCMQRTWVPRSAGPRGRSLCALPRVALFPGHHLGSRVTTELRAGHRVSPNPALRSQRMH